MFNAKFGTLALLVPFVSAITFNGISSAVNAGTLTISWTASPSDPSSFSLELVNAVFNNDYAIATNVQTANGQITIALPEVPLGDGYVIAAVNIENINQVFGQSNSFSISAATTSLSSAASTLPSTSASVTGTVTPTLTFSATTTPVSSVSSPAAASSSSSSASPSTVNSSGATSFKFAGIAPAVALVLSAMAGVVMGF